MEKFIGFRATFQEGESQNSAFEAAPPVLWLHAYCSSINQSISLFSSYPITGITLGYGNCHTIFIEVCNITVVHNNNVKVIVVHYNKIINKLCTHINSEHLLYVLATFFQICKIIKKVTYKGI